MASNISFSVTITFVWFVPKESATFCADIKSGESLNPIANVLTFFAPTILQTIAVITLLSKPPDNKQPNGRSVISLF